MERPWPAGLAGSPVVSVMERAIGQDRLSHSLLLHGEDVATLDQVAYSIADRLLNRADSPKTFPPERHPDCFSVRPEKKLRFITADSIRDLIAKVQVTATVSDRKVGIVHEADRMNPQASNIFLKTLEEPPPNTALLLLSARPYALLPTILSRVLRFRISGARAPVDAEGWPAWIADYQSWLERLSLGTVDRPALADHVFTAYGLVARFAVILEKAAAADWARQKVSLPEGLADDELTAIETGVANGLRNRLFVEIERATRAFAQPRLGLPQGASDRTLPLAVDELEHSVRLLRFNLNELAALENFFLASLRIWTRA
jgi:DNA polymerase-3 subunit delta'